jgi:hypothetical protein
MTDLLLQIHELLISAVLIVAFSLLVYIALNNWRNDIVRALCVLLASVVIVYGGDVLVGEASRDQTLQFLLRAQWLGIALVPAAYMHLSNALLAVNRGITQGSKWRWVVRVSYLSSVVFFLLALKTDLVVQGGTTHVLITQVSAGPLFWAYLIYLAGSVVFMLRSILETRRHALSHTLRRRLTYLSATFAAPGVGVFPYLVITGDYLPFSERIILLLSSLVSIGVMGMIIVMTYSIAFQGMLLPDRLIKHDFTRWLLYGPVVGVTIILCIQGVLWLENLVGLPGEMLITFVVMFMTVLMPIIISRVRPYLDTLLYMQDHAEIDYLRELPRNTFTRTDLRQLLENTLTAVCGALGAATGFVVGQGGNDGYTVNALCGSRRDVKRFVAEHPLAELMPRLASQKPRSRETLPSADAFLFCDGFCLLPLHSPDGIFLGVLGVVHAGPTAPEQNILNTESRNLIRVLAHQIELALTTVDMQQRIFDTLRGLGPEMQSLQQLSTRLEQATPASLSSLETDVALLPEFPQLVKDALTHYWGGPKLFESPLLGLRSVRRMLQEQGGTSTRALQAVLRQAINNLRPDEQLDPSAQEWLLYNLLELRYLQGKRIRDVAHRLSMSESDFYRKQRVAVEEVARQLVLMEDGDNIKVEM